MNQFRNLLHHNGHVSIREAQDCADQQFPRVVKDTPLHLWCPGQPVHAQGLRLLIGIATYSRLELRLLDLVVDSLLHQPTPELRVDVFNAGVCQSMAALDEYVPGIGMVFQTPVVGLWENGILRDKAWGKEGRDLVVRMCALSPNTVEQLVKQVP